MTFGGSGAGSNFLFYFRRMCCDDDVMKLGECASASADSARHTAGSAFLLKTDGGIQKLEIPTDDNEGIPLRLDRGGKLGVLW